MLSPRLLTYLAGLVVGALVVGLVFPGWNDLWAMPPGDPRDGDFAQHVIGQRYFLADGWHWRHFLWARGLGAPTGVNVGLTDSIPLEVLALKPFAGLLPAGFQGVTGWLALCWLLQPVAGVFLLRSLHERRLRPCVTMAVLASMTPAFLLRINHEALSSHFCLMVALGLSLRLVDPAGRQRRTMVAAGLLLAASLLIHPYVMLMVAAVLAAAPLTLVLRRDRRWVASALFTAAALAGVFGLAKTLGYIVPGMAADGFGTYSMNLLSPVWPSGSFLFDAAAMDATGGQYEGYQYLGAGVLLAAGVTLALSWRAVGGIAVRHGGLVLACLGLAVAALSSRIYFGDHLLATWPAPEIAGIVRASGRLFWPVTYLIEAGSVAALARLPRRTGVAALVSVALLQVLDMSTVLRVDWAQLNRPQPRDDGRLEAIMRVHALVAVFPPWPCEPTAEAAGTLLPILWIAARSLVPVTTAYTARQTQPTECGAAANLRRPLGRGELRILLPGHAEDAALVPQVSASCRRLGALTLCSADRTTLDALSAL